MTIRKQKRSKTQKKRLIWILSVGVILLVVVGLLGAAGRLNLSLAGKPSANNAVSSNIEVVKDPAADPRNSVMAALIGKTRHFKGSPDAPVTILEFSDFQ